MRILNGEAGQDQTFEEYLSEMGERFGFSTVSVQQEANLEFNGQVVVRNGEQITVLRFANGRADSVAADAGGGTAGLRPGRRRFGTHNGRRGRIVRHHRFGRKGPDGVRNGRRRVSRAGPQRKRNHRTAARNYFGDQHGAKKRRGGTA